MYQQRLKSYKRVGFITEDSMELHLLEFFHGHKIVFSDIFGTTNLCASLICSPRTQVLGTLVYTKF